MRNQVDAARRLGIRAITINSSNSDQRAELYRKIHAGEVDCLLVSPERLANASFMEELLRPILDDIGLLVVDEAHCISDWGHDFRPDYRRLVNILRQLPPNMPVLGTTATANQRVIDDIVTQLGEVDVQRGSLVRESLSLQNLAMPDQASRLAWLAQTIPALDGTGIVYTLTTRDATQVCDWLQSRGIDAAAYHGRIEHEGFADSTTYREHLEGKLLHNGLKVLVATTALGMGYDKPDLHFVIHYQMPGSVVAYYQQVGRAGRALDQAYGLLLAGTEDEDIHAFFRRSSFPDSQQVRTILSALDDSDGLSVRALEAQVNLRQSQIQQVLKFLSVERPSPVMKDGSKWHRTPVDYRLDQEKIQRLTGMREAEWQQMQAYVAETGCLMQFLENALDDPAAAPCGKCANCLGKPLFEPTPAHELVVAAAQFLRHSEFPLKTKKQVAAGAFPEYGFRGNLAMSLRAEEGRTLSRWGDAAWGKMVAADKHAGKFRDELVTAMADMIRERWRPQPAPQWVTCIPSRRHPKLVLDFAERLAAVLQLPFHAVIEKTRDNAPQKAQDNRFHQCHNLDGAFAVRGRLPEGPVLLVDDIIDSGWTLTVAAALLRRAGSGSVYPVALAAFTPGN